MPGVEHTRLLGTDTSLPSQFGALGQTEVLMVGWQKTTAGRVRSTESSSARRKKGSRVGRKRCLQEPPHQIPLEPAQPPLNPLSRAATGRAAHTPSQDG